MIPRHMYPRTVRIKKKRWRLRFVPVVETPTDKYVVMGVCNFERREIKIQAEQSLDDTLGTWIHENVHALDNAYKIGLTHKQVYALEEAIKAFLMDNILPRFLNRSSANGRKSA